MANKINIAAINRSSLADRAFTFWSLDLAEAERAMGVDSDVIKKFKIDTADDRVPRQGFVLDKFDHLSE